MDFSTIFTVLISVAALSLSVVNYVRSRRDRELTNDLQAESLLDEAFDLLKDPKRLDEAGLLVARAAKLSARNPRVVRYRGYVQESEGRIAAAKDTFRRLLDVPGMELSACMQLARMSEEDERMKFYQRAADCDPEFAEPLYQIGLLHKQAGNTTQALTCLEKAIAINEAHAGSHVLLGGIRRRLGETAEAKRHLERAISIDSSNVDARVALGVHYIEEEGKWDEGVIWIEDAMESDPADSYPHAMMAALHADRKEPEAALEHARRAVALDPRRNLSDGGMHEVISEMKTLLAARESDPREASE